MDTAVSLLQSQLAARDTRIELAQLLAGPSPRELAAAHRDVSDALRGETNAARDLATAQQALNDLMAPPAVLDVADAQDAVSDSLRLQEHAANDLADQLVATNAIMANPLSTSDQQARAQLALADAQNAVGDAARRTERAQEALERLMSPASADAVAAAQGRVADAQAAVTAATEKTLQARLDLEQLQAGPSADAVVKARLAVVAAEQAVASATIAAGRAVADYETAQKAGIRGAPAVVAALDARRDAARAVADADRGLARAERQVTLALQGVKDAQASAATSAATLGASAAGLNDKFDKLPLSAQRFVRVLIGMKDKADELRATAADGFFPGAEAGLLAAARNFEPVKKVVGETSVELGTLARRSGELVGSSAFGKDIVTVGHSNVQVMDSLGNASLSIVDAFRHVLVVAGPLTRWLGNLAEEWAANAAESAKAGRESGKMADFFDRTRSVLERVGSIVGHVARGLFGLGKTGSESGDQILESIDKAAKRFDEWANSTKGQADLKQFFKDTRELAGALGEVIGNLTKGFGILTLRLLPVVAALKLLGPYADEAVIAFLSYKLAMTGVNIATGLYNLLTWQALRATIAWRASLVLAAAATGIATAAQWLLNAAMTANPIGLIIVAIGALVAAFVLLGGNLGDIGDAFEWLWGVIKDGVTAVIDFVKDHWEIILSILTGPIGAAVIQIVKHWDDIKQAFSDGINAAIDAVKGLAGAIIGLGAWIVGKLIDGIKGAVQLLVAIGGWIKNRLVDGVHAVASGVIGIGSWILGKIVEGIKTITDALSSIGGWLKNRIVELVHGASDALTGLGSWVLNRVVDGIKTVTDGLASVGGWIKNRIVELVHAAGDGLKDLGGWMLEKIVAGLKGGANLFIDFVNDLIGVINKIPGVDIGKIKHFATGGVNRNAEAAAGNTEAFARGGAFGMTGGIIGQPIAVMGEEAPAYPEVVIPTNPAYRGRARQLAAYAAHQVGVPGFETGGLFGAIKGGLSGLWDLASGGLSALTGLLPGTGKLPDWMKGLGSWAIKHVTGWIGDKMKGIFGGDDGEGGKGLAGVMKAATRKPPIGTPYVYGGGHGGSINGGVDCSGGVSYALMGGKLINGPQTTDGLKVYGESGDGDYITIGVRGSTGRNAHTMMKIAGKFFESGSGHGWQQVNGWSGNFPIHRHPDGFATGGILGEVLRDAFDPSVVGYGLRQGGLLGSFKDGTDYVPRTGAYELHQGERVIPAGDDGDTVTVEIVVKGDGPLERAIADMIDVKVKRNGRDLKAEWDAGVTT